jgi:choline dehydrogenase
MAAADAQFDYVVIGAGAAGSIVAAQAALSGASVLLIEMGATVAPDDARVWDPTRWYEVLAEPSFEIGFHSVPQAGLNSRIIPLLQSQGLGGCQIHNAMVYVRGGRATYDYWANGLGCAGWAFDDLEPLFAQVEAAVTISSPAEDAFTAAFMETASRLGFPWNPDYNGGATEFGCVPFQFTVDPTGPRRTTAFESFIGAGQPNLTVFTQCRVNRLDLTQNPPGVEYQLIPGGEVMTIYPEREVVLAAGAIASPALLLRSGVGPADQLRALGIDVLADLPGVGQNFYDDLGVGLPVLMPEVAIPESYGYIGVGIFACSSGNAPGPTPAYAEVDIEMQLSTTGLPGAPKLPTPGAACLIGTSSLHLKSRGTVSLASADPATLPVVDPNWLAEPEDLDHVIASLRLAYDFARDANLAQAGGWSPFPDIPPISAHWSQNLRFLATQWIRATGLTVQHYVGSCAMGLDPSSSVVSPADLRVHGVQGLRVIDASVAPTPVTGNTAGVSMVIGAKGASLLLDGS